MTEESAARRGRPRSQHAHDAILKATADLMREQGYSSLSIEGIAARAGVGKQTIYRWWPSKGAVAVDAFLAELIPAAVWVDTGDFRADLVAQLRRVVKVFGDPEIGPHIAALTCAALHDPAVNEILRERGTGPSRAGHRAIIAKAQAAGDVRADIDIDLAIDIIYSVIWFRLLVGPTKLSELDPDALSDAVLRAIAPTP
jgi:AcrR family transcriptional regulator